MCLIIFLSFSAADVSPSLLAPETKESPFIVKYADSIRFFERFLLKSL
nr:MAG TPA: hypothetical protein [Crassvirales sp.]DAS01500.1 MAG TPA: hypothetical protein [Caudoviricetes sp.]